MGEGRMIDVSVSRNDLADLGMTVLIVAPLQDVRVSTVA